jgi:hypothetical protein
VVNRAVSTWCEIFGHEPFHLVIPAGVTCLAHAKSIKKFLSSCTSKSTEEVLAFQSIKKLLPSSCKCMEAPLLRGVSEKLSSPPRNLPSGYLSFVRRLAKGFFVKGWDCTYYNHCQTTSPPITGTRESSRRNGGTLAYGGDQDLFLDVVYGRASYESQPVLGELIVVQSAGKPRPLTKFSQEELLLKPLHKALYDHVSAQRWCCRGDVNAEKLKKAGFRYQADKVLVSGDYASATDNLPIEVAEVFLEEARASCGWVPDSVWNHAFAALRPTLYSVEHDITIDVRTGQMMGSYLSFPLLCLQNYAAFRWAAYKHGLKRIPLLINGDDILFQSDRAFYKVWVDTITAVGLEVEVTKTSVLPDEGTLNSTLLRWDGDFLDVVPTIRMGMLRPRDYANGLGSDFLTFLRGQSVEVKWSAGIEFFRWHLALLRRSGRLYANEWGFRGRLAWRIAGIFSLLPTTRDSAEAPPPPIPHNVSLRGADVVRVDKKALSQELDVLNSLEMVSWKWSTIFNSEQGALRYCLDLTMARPFNFPNFSSSDGNFFGYRTFLTTPSKRWVKKQFLKDAPVSEALVFREVLLSQDFSDYSPLPTYEQVTGGYESGDWLDGSDRKV